MGLASAWVELSPSLGHYRAYCSPEKVKYELTTHQQFFFSFKSSPNLLLIPHACQYKSYNSQVGMGKIHQDYRVFHFGFFKILTNDLQPRFPARCCNKMPSISDQTISYQFNYFEQVNTPPSTIFQFSFHTRLHLGWYQFMYVISHIYYFVMLLINLKFCIMRFLNEVIPPIPLMLPSRGYPSKTF